MREVVDLHAEPYGSTPRPVRKARWQLDSGKQVEKGDQEVGSAINAWGLLGGGLKGIKTEPTGFEPAIFCVTGRHVRPLHHGS
jgi:hypothetical protein